MTFVVNFLGRGLSAENGSVDVHVHQRDVLIRVDEMGARHRGGADVGIYIYIGA